MIVAPFQINIGNGLNLLVKHPQLDSLPEQTADILQCYHWFSPLSKPRTDVLALPRSGKCFLLVKTSFPHGTTNQKHYLDLGSEGFVNTEFLRAFLRRNLAREPGFGIASLCWLFSRATNWSNNPYDMNSNNS